jgi:hypothetical protein
MRTLFQLQNLIQGLNAFEHVKTSGPLAPAASMVKGMLFRLRLGGFAFRGQWRRSLPCEPFRLQSLAVVRECFLRDLVLRHCLLSTMLTECLTRIELGFGGRLCHIFTFSPISTSRRGRI